MTELSPDELSIASAKSEFDRLSQELGRLQRAARSAQLPIVIALEGWEASGKGTLINSLALSLDSRGYQVVSIRPAKEQSPLYPPLRRFVVTLPEAGRITIYDRSWYSDLWTRHARGRVSQRKLAVELAELHDFERMLIDGGTLIVKFFLHIDQREQKSRFRNLRSDRSTRWRIDAEDLQQNKHFEQWQAAANEVLFVPGADGLESFILCDGKSKRLVKQTAFGELTRRIADALERATDKAEPAPPELPPPPIELSGPPPEDGATTGSLAQADEATMLSEPSQATANDGRRSVGMSAGRSPLLDVDLSQRLSREDYEKELPHLQARLRDLEHRIYKERIPVVISCEGWDAAGKGGSIRRLLAGLDPRGYDVHPISAPSAVERQHHYLWRFWTRLPKGGHIAVFDRSWYGRVLVERVEGFCSESEWKRAYQEIAAFERCLVRYGTILIKLWFHIDQETQLARFRDRETNDDKHWKITDEDWRNRERWADYEAAVADMLVLNHSEDCPYTVVPANDKLFARHFTLRTVVEAIEKGLA
jgi:AMP-polyphosphate phosphotransferase